MPDASAWRAWPKNKQKIEQPKNSSHMKTLQPLSYIEQQEITAMQEAFNIAGCVFEFAVFGVIDPAEDQAILHKEALDRLCEQNNHSAAKTYDKLVATYPSAGQKPFVGCEYKTELARPLEVGRADVQALCKAKMYSADERFYQAFFQALVDPPYSTRLSKAEQVQMFKKWCDLIGLIEADEPKVFDWVNDPAERHPTQLGNADRCAWSNYFDDGLEWWGVWCFTIWNPKKQTLAALMASATD
jgi:hypothetical protein